MTARRWGFRILIAFILGVITTIAVAWWCGWRSELSNEFPLDQRWVEPPRGASADGATSAHDLDTLIVMRFSGPGIEEAVLLMVPETEGITVPLTSNSLSLPVWGPLRAGDRRSIVPGDRRSMNFIAQGWPWRALWCEKTGDEEDILGGHLLFRRHIPNTFMMQHHVLAFRPSWPEFAASVALYGSVWMTLLFAPGAIRRCIRRRCGRCTACGYDLRATSGGVCPECGMTFAHRA